MLPHLRKRVAQVGVLLWITSLSPFLSFPLFVIGGIFFLGVIASYLFVLLLAALLPSNPDETWGRIWPIAGYENAIDAIYTRGPWWQRFQELDEVEA